MNLLKEIVNKRKQMNIDVEEISAKIGMTNSEYQSFEKGDYKADFEQFLRLCKILDLNIRFKLEGEQ